MINIRSSSIHCVVAIALLSTAPLLAAETVLVIKGGSLLDPVAGTIEPVQAIIIECERIVAVGTARKPVEIPPDAHVIDSTEKFIPPA